MMNWNRAGPSFLQKPQGHMPMVCKICSDQVKKEDEDECKIEYLSRKRKRTVKKEDVKNAFQVRLAQKKKNPTCLDPSLTSEMA